MILSYYFHLFISNIKSFNLLLIFNIYFSSVSVSYNILAAVAFVFHP